MFSYDQAGRLSQVADNGGTPTTYAYDTFERRVARNAPGEGLRHFVSLTDGRLAGEYDGATGAVIAEYLWLGDALVGEVNAAGVVTYVQTGPLGQPLAAMNQVGAVVWRGELSPFGELVTSTGTPVPKLRFAGQWTETGSGLSQNWHRTYDATLGRYLEADPLSIAAGQSVYGYAGQDPANAVDPEGLEILVTGSLRFKSRVADALTELRSVHDMGSFLDELESSDELFIIAYGISNQFNEDSIYCQCTVMGGRVITRFGDPCGGRIEWDPDLVSDQGSPPVAGLAHELGHAWDAMHGLANAPGQAFGGPPGEFTSMIFENYVRVGYGLGPREGYYSWDTRR